MISTIKTGRVAALLLCSAPLLPGQAEAQAVRRVLALSSGGCAGLPAVPGTLGVEPLVPAAAGYPPASQTGILEDYCVYELTPGADPNDVETELSNLSHAFDSKPELLPLDLHRQAISVPAPGAVAEAAHSVFLEQAGAWEAASASSPNPNPVRIVVIDDVSRAEARAACGQSGPIGAPCSTWPADVASARGTVGHGVAVARVAEELACPSPWATSACSVTTEPELALDTDFDPALGQWSGGRQYGDVVSLIRAVLRSLAAHAGSSEPVVMNLSVGIDSATLGYQAGEALAAAIGLARENGALLVMAAGNAHHASGRAATGLLAPAHLTNRASFPTIPSHAIRPVTNGFIVPVAGVNPSFSPLGMGQLEPRTDAYLNDQHMLAPGAHAAPLASSPLPRIYTGTSIASAATSGMLALLWNIYPTDDGSALLARLQTVSGALARAPVDSRFGSGPIAALPVLNGVELLDLLLPGAGLSGWGFGGYKASPSTVHLSPENRARDALAAAGSARGPTVANPTPLGSGFDPLERMPHLRPQPDPLGCDICAVLGQEVYTELPPMHGGLIAVEIILHTDFGEEVFGIPPGSMSPYAISPKGMPLAGRILFIDPGAGGTYSAELDVHP